MVKNIIVDPSSSFYARLIRLYFFLYDYFSAVGQQLSNTKINFIPLTTDFIIFYKELTFSTTVPNNNNPEKENQKKQGKKGLGPSCVSPGREGWLC